MELGFVEELSFVAAYRTARRCDRVALRDEPCRQRATLTAGPVGQPLRPFHRRDALPRGTLNDGADGGDDVRKRRRRDRPIY